jgi:hypothetical protein
MTAPERFADSQIPLAPRNTAQFALSNVLGCGPRPTQDKAHEAARIHHASRRRGSQQAEMRRIRASRQRPTDRFGRRRAFYLLNAACKPF